MTENSYLRHKLEGNWTFNPTISELLTGNTQAQELRNQMVISITEDEEVLEEIPQENCDMLMDNGQQIYMAGMFKTYHILVSSNIILSHLTILFQAGVASHTFVLTAEAGVPQVVYWVVAGDGQWTKVVNFLSMAPATEDRNDLLFIGGAQPDTPFNALQRIERRYELVIEDNTPRQ